MGATETVFEIDPAFFEVVSKVFPAADPRALWDLSKMADQSEVHVNGGDQPKNNKKKIAAGLIAGTAIEAAAAGETIGPLKRDISNFSRAKKAGGTLKAIKPFVPHGIKLHQWGSGTKAALMGGNLLVGVAAARELGKKPDKPKQQKETIPKRAPEEFLELCQPIIRARRDGVISTDKALEMISDVEKGYVWRDFMETKKAVKYPHSIEATVRQPNHIHREAEKFRRGLNEDISRGRKVVGTVAAGAAVGVGVHAGKKAEQGKLLNPSAPKPKQQEKVATGVAKADTVDYEFTGDISKMDDDKRQVFGWCSLSTVDGKPVVDLQNDYITIEEIEKSAYDYVKKSRKGGDMHARMGDEPVHTSDMIESVIVTPDKLRKMGIPEDAISKVNTGWWVGFQVNDDEQWRKVKTGERAGFSIHGKGQRLEKVLDD